MFMDICIMAAICVAHLVHDTTLLSIVLLSRVARS